MNEKKIVIVDDDRLILASVEKSLAEKGFKVFPYDKGTEGLAAIYEIHPDVILLDLLIPDKGGYEIAEDLWKKDKNLCKKIIMMTTLNDYTYIAKVLEFGVESFIEKNETTSSNIAAIVESKILELQKRGLS